MQYSSLWKSEWLILWKSEWLIYIAIYTLIFTFVDIYFDLPYEHDIFLRKEVCHVNVSPNVCLITSCGVVHAFNVIDFKIGTSY